MVELRAVFDTNCIVSAVLLPRSVPRAAFDTAFALGSVLVSDATLDELNQVLRRPKFDRYLREQERLEFVTTFAYSAEYVPIVEHIRVCRDPKDDMFLEVAASGNATHLVTGDEDLLVMNPFRSTTILSPQQFVDMLSSA